MPWDTPMLPVQTQEKIQTPRECKPDKTKWNIISQSLDSVSSAGPSAMLQSTGNTYQVPLQGKAAALLPQAEICVPWNPGSWGSSREQSHGRALVWFTDTLTTWGAWHGKKWHLNSSCQHPHHADSVSTALIKALWPHTGNHLSRCQITSMGWCSWWKQTESLLKGHVQQLGAGGLSQTETRPCLAWCVLVRGQGAASDPCPCADMNWSNWRAAAPSLHTTGKLPTARILSPANPLLP